MGKVVAITGVSGQLGRILLSLLARDSGVDRIIGIDVAPFSSELEKFTFHCFLETLFSPAIICINTIHDIQYLVP